MMFVDAIILIVFIVQAPRGVLGFVRVLTFRLPRPHGCMDSFGDAGCVPMSDMRPTMPGTVASLVCSLLAWGGTLLSLLFLMQAGGDSPDGTGGILWLLISAPLVLVTVILWLTGFIWGCVLLKRIRRGNEQLRGGGEAWTAIGLGMLLALFAGVLTTVATLFPQWIGL